MKNKIDRLIDLISNRNKKNEVLNCFEQLDLNLVGSHGRSPLMMASTVGDLEMAKLLVEAGADPNFLGLRGTSPLHEASANGDLKIMKFLIDAGSHINSVSEDGITPLMCAAAWGHADAVKYLLSKGADKSIKDKMGSTASDIAEEKGEDSIASMIENFDSLV